MAEFIQTGGSNGGNYAKYFTGKLTVWENWYDIENNASNVGYRLELVSGSSGRFSTYSASYSVTLDGTVVNSGSGTYSSQSYNTAQTICEGTTTIYHNSDGTKSISCSAVLDFASGTYSPGDFYPSGTLALSTIPRKSSMSVSVGTIGGTNPTFTISRKSNSFTDSIYYIDPADNQEKVIVNKTSATSYSSWAAPTSLYASFPNASSITLTYKIYTYNGSTLIGSDTATGTINANVSASRPTVSVTATPTDYSSLTGNATTIINGVSNVTISATATPKNSATIKSITTNGETIATNATTGSKTLNKVTTGTFTTTVTDSRNFTNSPLDTKTFEFVNYVPVSISANAYRTNATSSTVKAVVSGNFFNAKFGTNGVTNTLTLTWKYKLKSASSYSTGGTLTATKSGTTYTTGEVTLGTNFSYENDYDFLFTAVDKVNTSGVTAPAPVKKGTPIFDYGVDSNENNYLNINGGIYQFNIPIIEKNTNYIKFYDGTAIFKKTVSITTAINTTWGNWYESSIQSFGNFDSGLFIEAPIVCIQPVEVACWVESLNATTKDYIGQAYLARPIAETSKTYYFNVIAVGNWK